MKLSKLLGIVVLALGVSVGTQSCKSVKGVSLADLEGTWNLKTLNGVEAKSVFDGPIPSAKFDVAQLGVSGNGGCNTYTGSFTYDKGLFSAPNLAATMRMCMHENKETEFFKTFAIPSKLSISETGNLIFTQNGKDALVFEKSLAIAEADLAGVWTLATIDGGVVADLFNSEKLPTIEFKEGRLGGHGGCNRYNGQYTLDGNVVKVGPLMSTRMACDYIDGEGKLLKTLEGDSKLVVEGNTLSFVKDGASVLVFKK